MYVDSHPSAPPGTTVSYCVIILSLMCHHCVTFKLNSRMLRIISYIKFAWVIQTIQYLKVRIFCHYLELSQIQVEYSVIILSFIS